MKAPTPVTAFFATAPKVAAMAMLVRMAMEPFAGEVDAWRQIVIFAALASMVVGALGAIGRQNLKRLLAYSSINNVGFILIGLAAATPSGVAGVMTYLAIYVAMTVGSFTALLMLRDPMGQNLETFDDIAGLSTNRPALAWCLLALMFSLAGIPPLFGFWGKFVVLKRRPGRSGRTGRHRHRRQCYRRVLLHQVRQGDVLRRCHARSGNRKPDRPLDRSGPQRRDHLAARLFPGHPAW